MALGLAATADSLSMGGAAKVAVTYALNHDVDHVHPRAIAINDIGVRAAELQAHGIDVASAENDPVGSPGDCVAWTSCMSTAWVCLNQLCQRHAGWQVSRRWSRPTYLACATSAPTRGSSQRTCSSARCARCVIANGPISTRTPSIVGTVPSITRSM